MVHNSDVTLMIIFSLYHLYNVTSGYILHATDFGPPLIVRVGVGPRNGTVFRTKDGATAMVQKISSESFCGCRTACEIHPECVAFVYQYKLQECQLFHDNLIEDDIERREGYIYSHHPVNDYISETLHIGSDGLYYYYNDDHARSYSAGKSFCKEPGFDFPVVITRRQFDAVKKLNAKIGTFFLGLTGYTDEMAVWANGMLLDVTTANTGEIIDRKLNGYSVVYQFKQGTFQDVEVYKVRDILCQANLDRIPWNE